MLYRSYSMSPYGSLTASVTVQADTAYHLSPEGDTRTQFGGVRFKVLITL